MARDGVTGPTTLTDSEVRRPLDGGAHSHHRGIEVLPTGRFLTAFSWAYIKTLYLDVEERLDAQAFLSSTTW
jgi:hypothetical protein